MRALETAAPTLAAVVDRLSPVVLDLLTAPSGGDVPVRRVVIAGPADDVALGEADIVLLVGGAITDPDVVAAVARCATAGGAAVVVKLRADEHAAALRLFADAGIALVAASPSADWGQVFTLLRTAVSVPHMGTSTDQGPSDLFALADAIAAATGGATTIEDRDLRVVAYSNLGQPIDDVRRDSILGRSVPTYVMARGDIVELYRRLWLDTDVVRLPAEDDGKVRPRLGAVVRAGDEVVGTIWVVEGDTPFDLAAEEALAESTTRAALLLLQHRSAGGAERRRRCDAVRAALDGGTALPVELAADEQVRLVALGTRPPPGADAASRAVRRQRLADLVAFQLELSDARATAVDTGEVVLAIVPEPSTSGARRRRELIADVVQRATHALKADVFAGIGGAARDVAGIPNARWEAEQSLRALVEADAAPHAVQVCSFDDVRSTVVMQRVRELLAGDERCRMPQLDLLARHDATHHTDHLATLGAYLDSFGDVSAAAARLGVHPNTLRYRLKRIVELLQVDLADPVTRFAIELQWRLRPLDSGRA